MEKNIKEIDYRAFIENSNDLMYAHTPDGTISFISGNVTEKLGYKPDELLQSSIYQVIHQDDSKKIVNVIEIIAKNKKKYNNIHYRLKTKSGEIKWYASNITPILDDNNNLISIQGIAHDITELKTKETQIEESKQDLKKFIEEAPYGIFMINRDGKILFCNTEACFVTKKRSEELYATSFFDLATPNDQKKIREYIQTYQKGSRQSVEIKLDLNSNNCKHVLIKTIKVCDEKLILYTHDITSQKAHTDKINQQNKALQELNGMKDKFLSIIAHDLKNPFTNLLGFLQLLRQTHKTISVAKREKYLNIVSDSAWQIYRLLENLLTWSRLNQNKIQLQIIEAPVTPIIQDTVNLVQNSAAQKNIKITFNKQQEMKVKADINMLQTVLRNLLNNSIKFTPENGEVHINYKTNGNSTLVFSVKDNGIGIPKNQQDKLFSFHEKFTRTGTNNEEGTGLGLILSKEFVEKNSGEIWVESEVDKGSTFYFTVPLAT